MRRLVALAVLVAAACGSEPSPAEEGRGIAERKGCLSCHSVDGSAKTGPTWKGLFGSRVTLDDGTMVVAGEDYLRESITDPDARTVRGFVRGVMSAAIRPGSVEGADLDALVAYIRSLR